MGRRSASFAGCVWGLSLNSGNFDLTKDGAGGLYTNMLIDELSYCECYNCENYFFVHELPMGINDPKYCPYCGIDFENVTEVETPNDL